MPVDGRALTLDRLLKKKRMVIGDEAGNTDFDPDTLEKAVSEGEARTGLPTLQCRSRIKQQTK